MTDIKTLIGPIRKFTKNVINIKDFYKTTTWDDELIKEYIENYDLNQEVISIINKIFKFINRKIDTPDGKGCIDLLGNFGTGKSHILLFLALLLSRDRFSEKIKESINNKLNENPDFFEIFNRIYKSINENGESSLTGILIIPIRLAEFKIEDFDRIIEIAVTRDILKPIDNDQTLISDVKKIIKFFKTEGLRNVCRPYIDSTEYVKFEKIYKLIIEGKSVNYSEVEKAAKVIDKAIKESTEMTDHISRNPLLDICLHPLLGRKYKNIFFIFDELTQWWKKSNDELLKLLQSLAGRIDDLATDELKNEEGVVIESNNIIAIFAHQRDIWIGNMGNTVRNRFEVTPTMTGTYINSIIAKRFFYLDQFNTTKINEIGTEIYDFLEKINIDSEIIERVFCTNTIPEIANIKDLKTKVIRNIVSFYPFHPYLFSSLMQSVFFKFSTENRGILDFVDECFTEYGSVLDRDCMNLINIDTFFTILNDKRLIDKKKKPSELYNTLERIRISFEPDDIITQKIIQSLILKLIGKEEPKFLKAELRCIFSVKNTDFENTIENYIKYCITNEKIHDINSANDFIELTLDKKIPIRIFIETLKTKIQSRHIYNIIKSIQENKPSYIRFRPRNTNNLRYKKLQFIDYDDSLDDIINLIESKDNSISNIKGKQNKYSLEVLDLIYYLFPPTQNFIVNNFKSVINKIKDNKISYVICKPKIDIIAFKYAEEIKDYIALTILLWCFDNVDPIQHGEAEPLYTDYFNDMRMEVPEYNEILDVIFEVSSKNPNIITDLRNDAENQKNDLGIMAEDWIDDWLANYVCYSNINGYKKSNYDKDEILDLDDEFEEYKYEDAFRLDEELTGVGADYIWEIIWKGKETLASKKKTAQRNNLDYGVSKLKILKVNNNTYSLIEENNLHRNFKKLGEYLDGLTEKTDIRSICYKFRLNKYGLSVYLSSLGLFYFYQRGKIRFYDSNNNQINKNSKYGRKKGTILEKTLSFINDFINQKGKVGKVELFPTEKWNYIIDVIKKMVDNEIIKIDNKFDDNTIIDLNTLKKSQSFEREELLFNLLKNHLSIEFLNTMDIKYNSYLIRIGFQKNKKIKNILGIQYFQNLIEEISTYSDCEELYKYLKKIEENFEAALSKFKIIKDFYSNKLEMIISIWDSCNNINLQG